LFEDLLIAADSDMFDFPRFPCQSGFKSILLFETPIPIHPTVPCHCSLLLVFPELGYVGYVLCQASPVATTSGGLNVVLFGGA
jgi:hypothetical protein